MNLSIIYRGKSRAIWWFYSNGKEKKDFLDWVDSLPEAAQKKLARRIAMIADNKSYPSSKEIFRQELGVFAIKSGQFRLYGCKEGCDFIVFFFLQKKSNRLTKQQEKQIKKRHHLYRLEKGGAK